MPRCPVCGAEIDRLRLYVPQVAEYEVYVDGNGVECSDEPHVTDMPSDPDICVLCKRYACPECDAEFAWSDDEAERFLLSPNVHAVCGIKIPVWLIADYSGGDPDEEAQGLIEMANEALQVSGIVAEPQLVQMDEPVELVDRIVEEE